ncbi:hypothetical protein HG531_009289 [Fusarium graminearum]|nr:hypothetical protein HG531_009289 [Fusarium graminearum]
MVVLGVLLTEEMVHQSILVKVKSSDPLWYLGIGVKTRELVDIVLKRVKDGGVIEALGDLEPFVVLGVVGNISKNLVHASKLSLHHLLHLGVAQLSSAGIDPASQGKHNSFGIIVTDTTIDIEKASKCLVDGIVGNVAIVQSPVFDLGNL